MEQPSASLNLERAAQTLSLAIAQETVAGNDDAFRRLFDVLRQAYPLVFSHAEMQTVQKNGLLLYFRGAQAVEPLLFTAHLDVVPVAKETDELWEFPPFAGVIADGYVWGRGSIDMKGHLIALFEALEQSYENGTHFERDIWIALASNEEVRGNDAQTMFQILKAQGVRPAFIIDEGIGVMEGKWGIQKPMAMIGIGEKGHINLTISAKSDGGHGAYPPKETALEKVIRESAKMTRLPLGLKHLSPSLIQMLSVLAPYQTGFKRFAFTHPKLCQHYLFSLFDKEPFGRAFLASTVAVTTAKGSTAINTLPESAQITLNCRIIQGDAAEKVRKRAEMRIDKSDVSLIASSLSDPSRTSPAAGPAWDALSTAISVHFPEAIPVPCLISGASDSRRYEGICDHIYRFSPFVLDLEEQRGKHGVNERLSLANLERGIGFFMQMIKA